MSPAHHPNLIACSNPANDIWCFMQEDNYLVEEWKLIFKDMKVPEWVGIYKKMTIGNKTVILEELQDKTPKNHTESR